MTWSLTPAELPRAGENSKTHHYKPKLQNMKDFPKTWSINGEKFEDFRRKRTKTKFSTFQKNPVEQTAPKYNNWIWPL